MKPYFERDGVTLYHGDAIQLLPHFTPGIAAAIVTDPPYSSGGLSASTRAQDPAQKYCQDGNTCGRPTFSGDAKDGRSFGFWSTLWLSLARPLVRSGGYALVFSDWRQIPSTSDALQAADFTWRGVVSWDKGRSARSPHKGYFRHQCEYVIWGTNGPCPKREDAGPFDGCFHVPVDRSDKHHICGKPVPLMQALVAVAAAGELVVDPFCGSATTLLAALVTGRRAIGFEREEAYCEIGAERLRNCSV